MARYADSLLTEGEDIVLRTRQHWLALLAESRLGWFLWILAIVLLIAVVWPPTSGRDLLRYPRCVGAIVLLVIGVVIIGYRFWQWWATDYIVTNRRLLKVTGIFNKRSADSSLEKINDAILTQPVSGQDAQLTAIWRS